MGSGGGGSAGKVEYADYLMAHHSALLSNGGIDVPLYSLVDELNASHTYSPFSAATTYTGRTEVGTINLTVGQALAEILSLDSDPFDLFQLNLNQVAVKVQGLFSSSTIQASLSADSEQAELETQRLLHKHTGRSIQNGSVYASSYVVGRTQILDAKMRSLLTSGTEKLSAAFIQLNKNKHEDTMALIETQWQNFKLSKTAYMMAVEHCQLTILNEREYSEQSQFYAKYSAHWEFERMQAGFNGLAMLQMGRKMTFVASPDMPKWMVQASWVFGDPVGSRTLARSKRFRATVMGGASGAAFGATIGGWPGAIVGAVVGGATSYFTYSEGEWR
jgi:hypothetical protein